MGPAAAGAFRDGSRALTSPPTPTAPFPADRHWKIAALWDYWIGVYRNVGRPPRRADIDPIDIPRLLPNLWIADWDASSARFRYRLVGTAVTKARNTDATGRFLDEDLPGLAESAFGRSLAAVVREGLRAGANHALQWEALQWARGRGCASYDFWGIPDALGRAAAA